MKIDIHTHTRKCKSGDAPTRDVTAQRFCEAVLSTEVGIVAITNHNVFDLQQYLEIQTKLDGKVQVWPGVELDVVAETRAHLLVIVAPHRAVEFDAAVRTMTAGVTADDFNTTIHSVLEAFDSFEPLYVAHYKQKKPALSDDALGELLKGTANPLCVIKEVTDSVSAGIFISHGHPSIYGSDIHDWKDYESVATTLPDLRLPVGSFAQFCLLLKKDQNAINTALDEKRAEELLLVPFNDGALISFRAYNDINVIFGPKGTGKTCILKEIAKHYSQSGVMADVFITGESDLNEVHDIKGRKLQVDLSDYGIEDCAAEIPRKRLPKSVART